MGNFIFTASLQITQTEVWQGADRPGRQSGGAAKMEVITAKVGAITAKMWVIKGHQVHFTTFEGGKIAVRLERQ